MASFFLTGLGNLNDILEDVARFSPLNYYQGNTWVDGLNTDWFLGLVGFGFTFVLIAWWRFVRRDIRVGGEGGWKLRLPKLLSFRRSSA